MSRFEELWIWDKVGNRLPWYFAVSTNKMPAKYLIAKRILCEIDLDSSDEEALWEEHARLEEEFLKLKKKLSDKATGFSELEKKSSNFMDLKIELVKRMLAHCNFCRWNCRVDRRVGTKHGTCQLESTSRVSCYFHHLGEELVFRGTQGSGTIFFTSCNMRCAFCQNSDISRDRLRGIVVSSAQLAAMIWQLRIEGCHNINLVGGEPTIHLNTIVEAIGLLDAFKPSMQDLLHVSDVKSDFLVPFSTWNPSVYYDGNFNAPILWNSNFFMSTEVMNILRTIVDVWLPDFKFGNEKCAIHLSKTPWYFETVSRNHKMIYDWGEDMLIRHLIMPRHIECCTKPVLKWIAENIPEALVNIMDQYRPEYLCDPSSPNYDPRYAEISRFPTRKEISEAYRYAKELGLNFETISYEKSITV